MYNYICTANEFEMGLVTLTNDKVLVSVIPRTYVSRNSILAKSSNCKSMITLM